MQIDLPIGAVVGQGRSLNANSGENLNCYIEVAKDGRVALVGTPGQRLALTLPNAPVRGCYSDSSISYWVAGNKLYKVNADLTYSEMGTLLTSAGTVKFASSGVDLMMVDGFAGYYLNLSTNVFAQITDPDFPANPVDVGYLRNTFVVTVRDSQTFYVSEKLLIATDWNGLDFATAEGNPDKTAALKIYQEEAIFIGYRSVEVWSFTGNSDFPLQRNSSVVIDHGCTAPLSVVRVDDSILWLGGDNTGNKVVYMMTGYSVQTVTSHEDSQVMAKFNTIDDAFGMAYQQDGHSFYILQFPSANHTMVYDKTTGLWHRRGFKNVLTGNIDFWRGSCICFNNSSHLVGDIESGEIYALELDYYTDNGTEIVRHRITTATRKNLNNVFFKSIRFDVEQGIGNALPPGNDPKLNVRWSDDSGHTWNNWRTISIGKIGQYGVLPQLYGLGYGRQRVWQIVFSDPCKFTLFGIVLDIQEGRS